MSDRLGVRHDVVLLVSLNAGNQVELFKRRVIEGLAKSAVIAPAVVRGRRVEYRASRA
jgi:hypothetical protein